MSKIQSEAVRQAVQDAREAILEAIVLATDTGDLLAATSELMVALAARLPYGESKARGA